MVSSRLGDLNARRMVILFASVVVLAGCWLRFRQLGHDGLWSDELFTAALVKQHELRLDFAEFRRITNYEISPSDDFWTAKGSDQSPPLYELVAKILVAMFGASERVMRLPSAIAGSMWLVFLGWRALRAREQDVQRAYVFTLVISAVSLPLLEYAQEARAYALGAFFAGVLVTQWLERWRAGFTTAALPGCGEATLFVLGCHSHYNVLVLSALLLTSYGAVALGTRRYRALMPLLAVPVACLPWVVISAHALQFSSQGGARWAHYTLTDSLSAARDSIPVLLGAPLVYAALAAVWLALGRGLLTGTALRRSEWGVAYLLVTLLLVDVFSVSLVSYNAGMQHWRHHLFALPTAHLALGIAFAQVVSKTWLSMLAWLVLSFASWGDLRAYYAREKQGDREITRWLAKRVPHEAPLVFTFASSRIIRYYYFSRYFGAGAQEAAIPISDIGEAVDVCEKLRGPVVGVIAPSPHRALVDAALAGCDRYQLAQESELNGVIGQVWTERPPVGAQ